MAGEGGKLDDRQILHATTRPEATPLALFIRCPPCTLVDPDLAVVIEAWPVLTDHIRRAILALVETAK